MNRPCHIADITMRESERSFTYNNTTVLTLSIRRPETRIAGYPRAQNRINSRFRMLSTSFYRYASTTLYRQAVQDYIQSQRGTFPFRAYDAVMQFIVTLNQGGYLSTYNDQYQFTGGAHGTTLRASDTFLITTGQRLPLSHFFRPCFDYRGFLLGQILQQADRNMRINPHIYFEDYRSLIVQNFNPQSYFLTPRGINIYYQQYEIAPYATGIVVFTIPFSEFRWHLPC